MAELSDVKVPDIGDFDEVEVVEVLVSEGDEVEADDPLITLESDKASMDVPSPAAGTVREIAVQAGDQVATGDLVLKLEPPADGGGEEKNEPEEEEKKKKKEEEEEKERKPEQEKPQESAPEEQEAQEEPEEPDTDDTRSAEDEEGADEDAEELDDEARDTGDDGARSDNGARSAADLPYASPSIRKLARERHVDLSRVQGTGRKGRILEEDVERAALRPPADAPSTAMLPPMPEIDFSQFGEVEEEKLTKINRLTGESVHRSWLHVPHVTQFDEADITELEAFRKASAAEAEEQGFKLTFLSFLMAATAATLRAFPRFNSSLSRDGESVILKKYVNIGIAVDTPKGLVVPVVRDVDAKRVLELAQELGQVSERARSGKLTPSDFQGGTFTISSLGGIGGTGFTPIVNAPEVAILGVSRASMRPVWQDGEFVPRFVLPFSLSYDHRAVDGAAAARFTTHLARLLSDVRRLIL